MKRQEVEAIKPYKIRQTKQGLVVDKNITLESSFTDILAVALGVIQLNKPYYSSINIRYQRSRRIDLVLDMIKTYPGPGVFHDTAALQIYCHLSKESNELSTALNTWTTIAFVNPDCIRVTNMVTDTQSPTRKGYEELPTSNDFFFTMETTHSLKS